VDSNLVATLIIAIARAVRRLLRPARAGATAMIGAAGDLTRTRSQLILPVDSLGGHHFS